MLRQPLATLTANQVAEKRNKFLRDCAAYGDDVSYSEMVVTGGTFDPIQDKMVGGSTTPSIQVFKRAALEAPVRFDENADKNALGSALVLGHQLAGVVTGETYIARLKPEVPLTQTGAYTINGMTWRFSKLVDVMRVGKLVFWNVVMFVRA